ncbi:MAG TPA: response regulator [Polyangia bacterium]|nr:response regulator [Polyangia bacterium]
MPQRVLVVEDSTTMRGFVTATLESSGGFQVTQAPSGFEALKILPRAQYDVIITDINMPDINGLELVRYVRESERHARTPLVLISTDARAADRERGLKLGADAYLTKPFEPEELLAVVRKVLSAHTA